MLVCRYNNKTSRAGGNIIYLLLYSPALNLVSLTPHEIEAEPMVWF